LVHENGVCKNELFGVYKKAVCCCTIGKAFSSSCEKCPNKNTDEYKTLCGRTGHSDIDGIPVGKFINYVIRII
jgi:hypothetical protein